MVLTNLYAQMCAEELNEFSYAADIAGCRFDISATRRGVEMDVFGYSHKLPTLLQQVAKTVASPELEEAMFERLKDALVKTYSNFAYNQPYQHAMFNESLVVETPRWNYPDRIAALLPLTVQNLRDFKTSLLGRANLVVLMHGNNSIDGAIEAAQSVVKELSPKPLFTSNQASHPRVVQLPAVTTCIHQSDVQNSAETNNGIEVIFQIGEVKGSLNKALELAKSNGTFDGETKQDDEAEAEGAYRSLATLNVLMHLMKEPFFDDLRTKQQLGYLVFSGNMRFGDGHVVASRFILQSEVKSPQYLDQRIEAFLLTFRNILLPHSEENKEGLTDEQFAENISAVVETLLEKPKNLNEETNHHWSKLEDGSLDFGRKLKEAKSAGTVTRQEVLAYFDAYLGLNSSLRRKLSVRIHGSNHKLGVELKEEEQQDSELSPVPTVPGDVIMIESPPNFQRTRPLYPFRETVSLTSLMMDKN
jgi:insulysin